MGLKIKALCMCSFNLGTCNCASVSGKRVDALAVSEQHRAYALSSVKFSFCKEGARVLLVTNYLVQKLHVNLTSLLAKCG